MSMMEPKDSLAHGGESQGLAGEGVSSFESSYWVLLVQTVFICIIYLLY